MKRKHKIGRKTNIEDYEREEETFESFRSRYRWLRETPSCVKFDSDEKVLYEYSDSRSMYDFSERQKKRMRKTPQVICLFVLAGLLALWFFFALIYRLSTEADKGETLLSLLPSFFVTAVCVAILLISAFGVWGKFLRFVFAHNLAKGKDAAARANLENLRAELARADRQKPYENAIRVTKNAVTFYLAGDKYSLAREAVFLNVERENGNLSLTFTADGKRIYFPSSLPETEFVPLKKAFGKRMKAERATHSEYVRATGEKKTYGGHTLGSVIVGTVMSTVILAAAIAITVAHFLWVPQLPLLLGIFFIGGAGLCYCNTFSFIPVVSAAGLPFVFSLILTVCPVWFLVMIDEMITETPFSVWRVFSQCAPYSVAAVFLSLMGIYVFVHAVLKFVDYIRFGKTA